MQQLDRHTVIGAREKHERKSDPAEVRFTLFMPPEERDALFATARRAGLSASAVVRWSIRKTLADLGALPPGGQSIAGALMILKGDRDAE